MTRSVRLSAHMGVGLCSWEVCLAERTSVSIQLGISLHLPGSLSSQGFIWLMSI